jgi:hypothetical protein
MQVGRPASKIIPQCAPPSAAIELSTTTCSGGTPRAAATALAVGGGS